MHTDEIDQSQLSVAPLEFEIEELKKERQHLREKLSHAELTLEFAIEQHDKLIDKILGAR